jgi:hypothetical protein
MPRTHPATVERVSPDDAPTIVSTDLLASSQHPPSHSLAPTGAGTIPSLSHSHVLSFITMDFKRLIEESVEAERAKRRRLQAQDHSAVTMATNAAQVTVKQEEAAAVAMATNAAHVTMKQEEGAAVAMNSISPRQPVLGTPEQDELILSQLVAIQKPLPIDFGRLRASKRKTKGMLLS